MNDELINHYITPGEIINFINFSRNYKIDLKNNSIKELLSLLIEENYYSKDKFIKFYLSNIIQIYFLQLIYKKKAKKEVFDLHNKFIHTNYNCNKFNLNYENLFIEFKSKVLDG